MGPEQPTNPSPGSTLQPTGEPGGPFDVVVAGLKGLDGLLARVELLALVLVTLLMVGLAAANLLFLKVTPTRLADWMTPAARQQMVAGFIRHSLDEVYQYDLSRAELLVLAGPELRAELAAEHNPGLELAPTKRDPSHFEGSAQLSAGAFAAGASGYARLVGGSLRDLRVLAERIPTDALVVRLRGQHEGSDTTALAGAGTFYKGPPTPQFPPALEAEVVRVLGWLQAREALSDKLSQSPLQEEGATLTELQDAARYLAGELERARGGAEAEQKFKSLYLEHLDDEVVAGFGLQDRVLAKAQQVRPHRTDWYIMVAQFLVLWVGFLGASLAVREQKHINIEVVSKLASRFGFHRPLGVIIALFTALICAYLALQSANWVFNSQDIPTKELTRVDGFATFFGADVEEAAEGVRVTRLAEGSPAQWLELAPGDVILTLDGAPVEGPEEFAEAIGERSPNQVVHLRVRKNSGLEARLRTRLKPQQVVLMLWHFLCIIPLALCLMTGRYLFRAFLLVTDARVPTEEEQLLDEIDLHESQHPEEQEFIEEMTSSASGRVRTRGSSDRLPVQAEGDWKTLPFLGEGIRFSGGDGLSQKSPIIISGARNIMAGMRAETGFIGHLHGIQGRDWEKLEQRVIQQGHRVTDRVKIRLRDGEVRSYYFDISEFYSEEG